MESNKNIGISIYGTYGGFNIFFSHNIDKSIEKSFLDINGYFNFSVGKELYSVSFLQNKKIYTIFRTARDHVKRDGFYAIVLVIDASYKFEDNIFGVLQELANLFRDTYTFRNNINNVLNDKINDAPFLEKISEIKLVDEHKATSIKKQKALIYAEKSSDVIEYINNCNTFEFDYLFIIPKEFQFNIKTLAETSIVNYLSFENFKEKNKTHERLNIENSNLLESAKEKKDNDYILDSLQGQKQKNSTDLNTNENEIKSTQKKDSTNINKEETVPKKDTSNKSGIKIEQKKNSLNKNGKKTAQIKNSSDKNGKNKSLATIDKTEDSPSIIKRIIAPIANFYQNNKKMLIGSAALILLLIVALIFLSNPPKKQTKSNIPTEKNTVTQGSSTNTVAGTSKNTADKPKIKKTEIENTVDTAKINTFIKTPTIANYEKLNNTERTNSDVSIIFKSLATKELTNAFNYTQIMDFEPPNGFKSKNDSLIAYINSVKQLYCLDSTIKIEKIKIKQAKRKVKNKKVSIIDETIVSVLTIHDIYRKLLVVKEILGNYNDIAKFKSGKISTVLKKKDLDSIKKYRILLFNYRGLYGDKKRKFKNPYGLIKQQYQLLYNLGKILFMLNTSIEATPSYYDRNGKEQKGIVWDRIDTIIDNSCKN